MTARRLRDEHVGRVFERVLRERENEFLRLALMSGTDLETHMDRFNRDLADLENGIDHPND